MLTWKPVTIHIILAKQGWLIFLKPFLPNSVTDSTPEKSGFNLQISLDFASAFSHLIALITTVWSLCLDKDRGTKGEVWLFPCRSHCHTLCVCPLQQPQAWEGGSLLRGSSAAFIAASADTWRDSTIVSKVPDDLFTFKTTSKRSSLKWQMTADKALSLKCIY